MENLVKFNNSLKDEDLNMSAFITKNKRYVIRYNRNLYRVYSFDSGQLLAEKDFSFDVNSSISTMCHSVELNKLAICVYNSIDLKLCNRNFLFILNELNPIKSKKILVNKNVCIKITSCTFVNPINPMGAQTLHKNFKPFHGILALATSDLEVLLIDLRLDCSGEDNDGQVVVFSGQKITLHQNQHAAIKCQLYRQEGQVSCIDYLESGNLLACGFSKGNVQLLSLSNLQIIFSNSMEGVEICRFMLHEPENDPKSICYLWVASQSSSTSGGSAGLQLIRLYFDSRSWMKGFGYFYDNFIAAQPLFTHWLPCSTSSYVTILSCQKHGDFLSKEEEEEDHLMTPSSHSSIFTLLWKETFSSSSSSSYHLLSFDLNLWYLARMPRSLLENMMKEVRYMQVQEVPWESHLDILCSDVKPGKLIWCRLHHPQDSDPFLNYDYFLKGILKDSSLTTRLLSHVSQFLEGVRDMGEEVLRDVNFILSEASDLKLIASPASSITMIQFFKLDEDKEEMEGGEDDGGKESDEKMLLTFLLDQRLIEIIIRFIMTSQQPCIELKIDRDVLIKWVCEQVPRFKLSFDLMIRPYFLLGNDNGNESLSKLNHLKSSICCLEVVMETILNQFLHSNSKLIKKVVSRRRILSLVSLYVSNVCWFVHKNLLRYSSGLIRSGEVTNDYKERYKKMKEESEELLIEKIILNSGLQLVNHLKQSKTTVFTLYPPTDIQNLLSIYLIPQTNLAIKHLILLYFIKDLLLGQNSFQELVLINSFCCNNQLHGNFLKFSQACWYLDNHQPQRSLECLKMLNSPLALKSFKFIFPFIIKRLIDLFPLHFNHKQDLLMVCRTFYEYYEKDELVEKGSNEFGSEMEEDKEEQEKVEMSWALVEVLLINRKVKKALEFYERQHLDNLPLLSQLVHQHSIKEFMEDVRSSHIQYLNSSALSFNVHLEVLKWLRPKMEPLLESLVLLKTPTRFSKEQQKSLSKALLKNDFSSLKTHINLLNLSNHTSNTNTNKLIVSATNSKKMKNKVILKKSNSFCKEQISFSKYELSLLSNPTSLKDLMPSSPKLNPNLTPLKKIHGNESKARTSILSKRKSSFLDEPDNKSSMKHLRFHLKPHISHSRNEKLENKNEENKINKKNSYLNEVQQVDVRVNLYQSEYKDLSFKTNQNLSTDSNKKTQLFFKKQEEAEEEEDRCQVEGEEEEDEIRKRETHDAKKYNKTLSKETIGEFNDFKTTSVTSDSSYDFKNKFIKNIYSNDNNNSKKFSLDNYMIRGRKGIRNLEVEVQQNKENNVIFQERSFVGDEEVVDPRLHFNYSSYINSSSFSDSINNSSTSIFHSFNEKRFEEFFIKKKEEEEKETKKVENEFKEKDFEIMDTSSDKTKETDVQFGMNLRSQDKKKKEETIENNIKSEIERKFLQKKENTDEQKVNCRTVKNQKVNEKNNLKNYNAAKTLKKNNISNEIEEREESEKNNQVEELNGGEVQISEQINIEKTKIRKNKKKFKRKKKSKSKNKKEEEEEKEEKKEEVEDKEELEERDHGEEKEEDEEGNEEEEEEDGKEDIIKESDEENEEEEEKGDENDENYEEEKKENDKNKKITKKISNKKKIQNKVELDTEKEKKKKKKKVEPKEKIEEPKETEEDKNHKNKIRKEKLNKQTKNKGDDVDKIQEQEDEKEEKDEKEEGEEKEEVEKELEEEIEEIEKELEQVEEYIDEEDIVSIHSTNSEKKKNKYVKKKEEENKNNEKRNEELGLLKMILRSRDKKSESDLESVKSFNEKEETKKKRVKKVGRRNGKKKEENDEEIIEESGEEDEEDEVSSIISEDSSSLVSESQSKKRGRRKKKDFELEIEEIIEENLEKDEILKMEEEGNQMILRSFDRTKMEVSDLDSLSGLSSLSGVSGRRKGRREYSRKKLKIDEKQEEEDITSQASTSTLSQRSRGRMRSENLEQISKGRKNKIDKSDLESGEEEKLKKEEDNIESASQTSVNSFQKFEERRKISSWKKDDQSETEEKVKKIDVSPEMLKGPGEGPLTPAQKKVRLVKLKKIMRLGEKTQLHLLEEQEGPKSEEINFSNPLLFEEKNKKGDIKRRDFVFSPPITRTRKTLKKEN